MVNVELDNSLREDLEMGPLKYVGNWLL